MRRVLVLMVTMAVMLALAVPAGATPPSGVEIVVPDFAGPFTATGPAVDDDVVCAAGDVHDHSGKVTGFSSNGFNFQGIKHFICDDASGEFFINLLARIDFRKGVSFSWNVLSGTGDYENLRGAGSGFVVPTDTDVYQGGFHIS